MLTKSTGKGASDEQIYFTPFARGRGEEGVAQPILCVCFRFDKVISANMVRISHDIHFRLSLGINWRISLRHCAGLSKALV